MNFWTQLENQKITRQQLQPTLFKKLGQPTNDLQQNLCQEILKKITSYYFAEPESQNYTTSSLIGSVGEISERIRKSGKRKGQVDYDLKLHTKEILQARKEDLPPDKWNQITKLALLGQNLVFKYKKWFTNKQIVDFYPQPKK
ncbi:MAG: hypothetical protein MRERV_49c004 [Mycoplasmataceae bacterium RV_VA103A]|nr:MAG: hypothetical protein MRERV_49c004 [Mycoplasmataceae bacterium RV_VA103A]